MAGSPRRALYIGTFAPATAGWWHDLIGDGAHGTSYVQVLRGNPERWDQWLEIRRCNPLTNISVDFRRKLLRERDAARRHSRRKARFLSFRLNVPTAKENKVLLTMDEWKWVLARPVLGREGVPIFGYDTGHSRAWNAAVVIGAPGAWRPSRSRPGSRARSRTKSVTECRAVPIASS